MSPEHARILAVALVALTALLVGFQGASTLLTVTQLGASPPKATSAPRSHASLVPQAPLPVIKPSEPAAPAPTIAAGEDAPAASGPAPAPAEQTTAQVVTDNPAGIAAALRAKAQAEMDELGPMAGENAPPEPRRRYRAPRPELHKVY